MSTPAPASRPGPAAPGPAPAAPPPATADGHPWRAVSLVLVGASVDPGGAWPGQRHLAQRRAIERVNGYPRGDIMQPIDEQRSADHRKIIDHILARGRRNGARW